MLAQSFIAIIRTLVPTVVGTCIAWLAAHGLDLGSNQELFTTALIAACTTGYYALVTFLERKVHPAFGWLLGAAKAPTYDATAKLDESSPSGQSAAVANPLPDGTPVSAPQPILGKA
jgi:hypothetical protein